MRPCLPVGKKKLSKRGQEIGEEGDRGLGWRRGFSGWAGETEAVKYGEGSCSDSGSEHQNFRAQSQIRCISETAMVGKTTERTERAVLLCTRQELGKGVYPFRCSLLDVGIQRARKQEQQEIIRLTIDWNDGATPTTTTCLVKSA